MAQRNLKCSFKESFVTSIANKNFEKAMKKGEEPASAAWKHSPEKAFLKSTLGTLIKKPQSSVVKALAEKTNALKTMSLDFASAGRAPPK
jgi:hypothetical protein